MGRGLYRVNPSRSFDFLSSSCKKKGFEKYQDLSHRMVNIQRISRGATVHNEVIFLQQK